MQSPPGRPFRFWGLVHVSPLSVLFGFSEIFFILIQALIAGSYLASASHRTAAMIHMTVVFLTFIAVFLLLVGIFWKVPLLLGPHLVMQLTVTIILMSLAAGSVWCLISGTSVQFRITVANSNAPMSFAITDSSSFKSSVVSPFLAGLLLLVAVGFFSAFIFSIWCLRVVFDCYRSLSYSLQDKASIPTTLTSTPVVGDEHKMHVVIPATDF